MTDGRKVLEGAVSEAGKESENKLLFCSCNQCHFLTVMIINIVLFKVFIFVYLCILLVNVRFAVELIMLA